jgi:hypothetical protein
MHQEICNQALPFLTGLRKTFSIPYCWDAKNRQFVLIKDLKYMRTFRILSSLTILYMAIVTCSLLQAFRSETSLLIKMTGTIVFGFTAAITVLQYKNIEKAIQTVSLLNSVVNFLASSTQRGLKQMNNIGDNFTGRLLDKILLYI